MVAAEAPLFLQTHRFECGSYGSLSRSQDRTCQKQPDMRPDAFGEKWREGGQNPYHLGRQGTHISITSFWRIAVTSVPYRFRLQMAKVQLTSYVYSPECVEGEFSEVRLCDSGSRFLTTEAGGPSFTHRPQKRTDLLLTE